MNTYSFKLELNKGPRFTTGSGFKEVTIRKGDLNGTTIVAEIYDHGTKLTTANLQAVFEMLQPDRTHYYRETATYSNGTVSITLDESFAASVAGTTDLAYFRLYQGSQVIASTESFRVTILRSAEDEGDDPAISYDDAVPAAVDAWLEDHPEATTTVQDNSLTTAKYQDGSVTTPKLAANAVTTPKLADNAVTKPKLSAALRNALGNVLRGTATGAVAQAHGTYAAPPLGLTVNGKSVQDGTPTPSSPVAIQSVGDVVANTAGVNLLDPSDFIVRGAGPDTISADGYISESRSGDSRAWGYAQANWTDITLPAGTYTISFDRSKDSGTRSDAGYGVYKSNGDVIVIHQNNATFTTETFTLSAQTTIGIITKVYDHKVAAQLERGATASPYTVYTQDIASTTIDLQGHELRSLPDGTHDELRVDEDGNVTLVQRVGSITLNGTGVTWTMGNTTTDYGYFYTTAIDSVVRRDGTYVGIASAFEVSDTYVSSGNSTSNKMQVGNTAGSASSLRISIAKSLLSAVSKDGLNSWLASNNTTVLYPLATPVTHDLGTVTLPALAAPDATAWATTTPSTTVTLDYERDLTMAITAIESAIADMA